MADISEEVMKELLEDRKNGMGLQKASKKYGMGVPRIRKIEKEQGLEVAIPSSRPLRVEDVEKHFQESRESFNTVLAELQFQQKQIKALLTKIEEYFASDVDEDTELLEEMQENIEELQEDVGWQIGINTLLGGAALMFAAGALYLRWKKEPEKPKAYYTPPEEEKDLPKKKSTIMEME